MEEPIMREHLIVSGRGQVTLPASIRKKYGIGPGDIVILDDQSGQMVLKPAAVMEVDIYTDEQVRMWDEEDQLTETARTRILGKLGHKA
jgi:AbrB family looped-hinge helix DNA binding protein